MKKNSSSDRKKRKKNRRIKNSVFWTVIVILMAAGIYLIARPYYDRWQRNRLTEQLNASYISFHEKQVSTIPSPFPEDTEGSADSDPETGPGDTNTITGETLTSGTVSPGETEGSNSATVGSEDASSPISADSEDHTQPATGDTGSHTTDSEDTLPGESAGSSTGTESESSEDGAQQETYPTLIVDPEAYALPSEQEVWIRDTEVFQRDVQLQADGNVTLTVIGQMSIPKIDLRMPILDNALAITIRYGLGWYPDAQDFGENGNAVVFGHRMRNYGEHFNRVNELVLGDSIEVYHDGQIYRYEVTGNKIVEIKNVYDEILNHPDDRSQLVLATCHPIPTFEDYLLVYADLIEIR